MQVGRRRHSQVHRGAGVAPGGREAVVQEPSVGGRTGVGLLDRHQPRLEVERRRDAVERLQPLPRDGVDVAVQVHEAWSDHEAGHVDDGCPLRREGRQRRQPPSRRPPPRRLLVRSRSAGRPRARRGESAHPIANTDPRGRLTGGSDKRRADLLSDRTNTLAGDPLTVDRHVNAGEPPGHRRAAGRRHLARLRASPASSRSTGCPERRIAVLAGGEVATAAGGVTSLATQVPVDPDTVFQIGSITKIWTSDARHAAGRRRAARPRRSRCSTTCPSWSSATRRRPRQLTTRHLLTHTAGFEGDIFTDTGRGEDAIEKYVATLTDLPQLFAPGETFSYNNTAFVVLGRLVEVLRGQAVRRRAARAHRRRRSVSSASARARTRRSGTAPPSVTSPVRTARWSRRRPGRWRARTRRPGRCSR